MDRALEALSGAAVSVVVAVSVADLLAETAAVSPVAAAILVVGELRETGSPVSPKNEVMA